MNNDFFDKICKFEKNNNVFDLKIDGISFWILIRRRVIDNIRIDNNFITKYDYTVSTSKIRNVFSIIKYIFNAFSNKLKKLRKINYLIVNHPRKVLYNNEYIDIYTYNLQKKLLKNKEKFLILDVPLNWNKHLIKFDKNIRKIENFSILKKIYIKYIAESNLLSNEMLLALSNKLKKEFNSDGNLLKIVYEQLNIFKIDYKYYKKILKKLSPKLIYIVISDAHFGLVAAANDLHIEVVEIQHGIISYNHPTYSFPYNNKISYFPNRLSLYGRFWYDSTPLPIPIENIEYMENTFLYEKIKQNNNKNKKTILFITQGSITNQMIPIINDFCEKTKSENYIIYIKLHPSEYDVWQNLYPELININKTYNIKIIDNFDTHLYDLFNECYNIVGVSSTCLYEALCFNCNIHLLNLPTIETLDYLIKNNFVSLSNNAQELLKNIQIKNKNDSCIDTSYYYYKEEKNV